MGCQTKSTPAILAKSLIWAAIIIVAAVIMRGPGVDDSASMGAITGLCGAAWVTLQNEAGCRNGGLQ